MKKMHSWTNSLQNTCTKNPTANIIYYGVTECFSGRMRVRKGCPLSSLLFNNKQDASHCNAYKGNKLHIDWKGKDTTVLIHR